jgi:hypothetical protein
VRFRLAAPLAALAALALLAGGCGSSGAKSNGVADKSAQEIVQAALTAAKAATSVHVSGTINAGSTLKIDLHLVRDVGGTGTITTNGSTFDIVSVGGKNYFKADGAALRNLGAGAAAQLLQGKWFVAPASLPQLSSLGSITNLQRLFDAALKSAGKVEKGNETKVNGQPAIEVNSAKQNGTLYVATTGQPYPLRIQGSGAKNQGSIDFTDWNASVKVTAPANPVDLSKLLGG